MQNLPAYVSLLFGVAVIFTIFSLYRASRNSKIVLAISLSWIVLQAIVSASDFYLETETKPPRFILLPLPPLLFIIGLFITTRGRSYIDGLDLKWLTLLHIVRIPVELVLFWLFISRLVPKAMTFEGTNFDVISGISAIVVYYVVFVKRKAGRKLLLAWNVICLLFLFNIVITAVLSAPTPFQQLGFEQPNVGVLYFPFTWLPGYIVPVVLLAHLASIRQLTQKGFKRTI